MCFWPSAWVPYHLIQAPEHKKPDQRAIRGCCWFSFAKSGTWAYWTRAAEIVRIELHAQPYCVTTTGFHNKVSTVPESPWPKLDVEQKFEIQIQNFNRFFCNRFWNDFFVQNVVRKQIQIWNLVLIFGRAQGYNFVAIQLFLFHDPIIFLKVIRRRPHSEF